MADMQPYSAAVLGGLLSSSCCVVQLLLNSLSVGCAGFSVLSPYRPLFFLLTGVSLGASHLQHRSYRQSVWAVAISAVLAGTPEIVQLYNQGALHSVLGAKVRSISAQHSHWRGSSSSSGDGQRNGRDDAVLAGEQTVQLHAEGLRCAACGARLKQALLSHAEGVKDCIVDFASGAVAVTGRALRERDLLDTVQRLGYSARVVAPEHEPAETSRLLGKEL